MSVLPNNDGMQERLRSRLIAFAVGVGLLATLIALFVRWHLIPVLGERALYSTFLPAVLIAAYFGGFWPGLTVTILSAAAANYFIVEPQFAFAIGGPGDAVALILFGLTGIFISALCESLHRAQRRIADDERRRATEALRQTEERFRHLVQNSSDIISFFDADGTVLYQTPSIERVLGYRSDERIGKNVFRDPLVHPDDLSAKRAFFENVLSISGTPITAEFRLRHADGTWRDIEAIGQNLFNEPSVGGIVANYRDITERKRAEKALRESEQRWRSLTEALPQLVWSATPDGACDYFSTQWTEHTGIAEAGLLGWQWLETLHPEDREPTRQLWLESVAERHPYDVEYRVRRRDGLYRWFKTRGVPIRDSSGHIGKWFGTCTDITDLRQTEDALRESEQRFRTLAKATNDAVWDWNLGTNKVWWNEGVFALFGYHLEHGEANPAWWLERVHPDDRQAVEAFFFDVVRGNDLSWVDEYRFRCADGSYKDVYDRGYVLRDCDGRAVRMIGAMLDITARKRAEEDLRVAKEAAESANRAKDEFLANVSHEIRTPMNAILGMTDLVLDTPLTDDQRQSLRTVKSAADNLLAIINDLLDFSKIEAGKLELVPADFSLRAMVGDTLRALAIRAHKKNLELICLIEPEVPDNLLGDAGRLRQVLINLIGNAIKFTDQGEVVVRVEPVSGEAVSGGWSEPASTSAHHAPLTTHLRFSVRDTGIGIPPDKRETIFRAFEQEDSSTTRKYGGTGLGLTIAAQLVALMGGTISLESEPGKGSTFSFTVRLVRGPHQPQSPADRAPVVLQNLRVLIVDDNETNRELLERWLRAWRFEPTAVGDGLAALDALWHAVASGQPYRLALIDGRMRDTGGLALAAKIRERTELSDTRVMLLTSGDRPADLARSRELRINAHLLKPIQQEELLEAIYHVMSGGYRRKSSDKVELPIASAPDADSAPANVVSPPLRPLNILVAEDNEFNVLHLEQLLVRQGHRVRLAGNGRQALELLGAPTNHEPESTDQGLIESGSIAAHASCSPTHSFDLLLLDIHMPELDGFQVIRLIREHEQLAGGHLPVIALTARSRKEDRQQCLAAGMDDFLVKPLQAAELQAAIERVLPAADRADRQELSLLDPHALLSACGDDAVILNRICHAFRERLPEQLAAVQNALNDEDAPRLREAAHKLHGMIGAFSAIAGEVISQVEDEAAVGRLARCRPLVARLVMIGPQLIEQVGGVSIKTLRHFTGVSSSAQTQKLPDPAAR